MPLSPGTKLGQYEVVEAIGAGGMGEVYRARDTKLGREVAIKVLPEEFARDKERLERFEREARLLAQLNHANIATLHGLEEHDEQLFIVMELVEGETLAERIAKGPIPVDEAIPLFVQIAEGLEAAHEKGIIHRDLKPANIKIGPDGKPKILDFGLAKAFQDESQANVAASQSPTLTKGTALGTIMGTASYMSPEQARGTEVDERADVWSFGATLYEALTGKRAFLGATVSDTLAAVLRAEPDWSSLPAHTSPLLRQLLRRCLRKNPSERLHHMVDVRIEIQDAMDLPHDMLDVRAPRALEWWRRPSALFAAGMALSFLTFSLAWLLLRSPVASDNAPTRFVIYPPSGQALETYFSAPVLSPDGRYLVFAANQLLYSRAMDGLEATPIPGTEEARSPFFSPDGEWVGFLTPTHIKKVAMRGGTPLTVCPASNAIVPTWGPRDVIFFGIAGSSGLFRVPASGGTPEPFSNLADGEIDHDWPQVLPDGETVLYTIETTGNTGWDDAQMVVQNRNTGERKVVLEGGTLARYASSGHLVYARSGSLLAVPFDVKRLEVTGNPRTVLEGVTKNFGGFAAFSLSESGTIAYIPGGASGVTGRLVWVDREGREEVMEPEPRHYDGVRLSPDGTRAAMMIQGPDNNIDVRIYDFESRSLSRLTTDPGEDIGSVWTPNGGRVAFASTREGPHTIFWKTASGTDPVERLVPSSVSIIPYSWSPDGKNLAIEVWHPETGQHIGLLSMEGDRSVAPLIKTPFREDMPSISPDGRWLAYGSNESGQPEVYVSPFPNVEDGRWPVSRDGGWGPVWSSDGREIFYRDGDAMMAVAVENQSGFQAGTPEVLFEGRYYSSFNRAYDVSPEGRFLMIKPVEAVEAGLTSGQQIVVVLNWFEELKRLVPTDN